MREANRNHMQADKAAEINRLSDLIEHCHESEKHFTAQVRESLSRAKAKFAEGDHCHALHIIAAAQKDVQDALETLHLRMGYMIARRILTGLPCDTEDVWKKLSPGLDSEFEQLRETKAEDAS